MEETPGGEVSIEQIFKFIIIGDVGVGKSCLLLQFTDQRFRPTLDPTIGCEASTPIVDIDGKLTKLQIWDTTGQELYCSTNRWYCRGAAAAILVYDITRRETFDHVARWLKDAMEVAPANLTTILIGNKCDLSDRRTVSYEEGETFAKTHGLFFMESSAKTAQNVEEAFTLAARTVFQKIKDGVLDLSAKSNWREIPGPVVRFDHLYSPVRCGCWLWLRVVCIGIAETILNRPIQEMDEAVEDDDDTKKQLPVPEFVSTS